MPRRRRCRDVWRNRDHAGMVGAMLPPSLLAQLDQVWPIISAAPELSALVVLACLLSSLAFFHLLCRRELKTKAAVIDFLAREKDAAEKRLAEVTAELARLKDGTGAAAPSPRVEQTGEPSTEPGRLAFDFGGDPPCNTLTP